MLRLFFPKHSAKRKQEVKKKNTFVCFVCVEKKTREVKKMTKWELNFDRVDSVTWSQRLSASTTNGWNHTSHRPLPVTLSFNMTDRSNFPASFLTTSWLFKNKTTHTSFSPELFLKDWNLAGCPRRHDSSTAPTEAQRGQTCWHSSRPNHYITPLTPPTQHLVFQSKSLRYFQLSARRLLAKWKLCYQQHID